MSQDVLGVFISWIREGLQQPGKNQAGLAKHMDVAHPQIVKLVSGRRSLKVDEVQKIAEYLEIDPPSFPPVGSKAADSDISETKLRAALLSFGVDREDLGRAVSAVKVFVDDHDEQSQQDLPDDQPALASRRRERAP